MHTIEPGAFKTGLADLEIVAANMDAAYNRLDPEFRNQWGQRFFDKSKSSVGDSVPGGSTDFLHVMRTAFLGMYTLRLDNFRPALKRAPSAVRDSSVFFQLFFVVFQASAR